MRERRTGANTFGLWMTLALLVAMAPPAVAEGPAADAAPATTRHVGPGAPKATHGPGAPGKSAAAGKPAAARGYQLARSATVASGVNVHDKVLQECAIETALPQMIAERSPEITLVDSPGANRLELRIVDIHAPNGGWFSGPKWITVEGKLLEGKTVKGNFVAKEGSMASATACGMLHKVMLVLAGDISTWLQNPSRDARLGGAH